MSDGWIKLHRQFKNWEWYTDANAMRVFLHLLITANHKENNWRGHTVERGQVISSLEKIAIDVGITVKAVRVALTKLKKTKEVASHGTNKFTLFTIINYDLYQSIDTEGQANGQDEGKQGASKGQTKGKQRATNKNDKNDKNAKNEDNEGNENKVPPPFNSLKDYFSEKLSNKALAEREARKFFNFYDSKNWMIGKNKMTKWRSAVTGWIGRMDNNSKPTVPENYDPFQR